MQMIKDCLEAEALELFRKAEDIPTPQEKSVALDRSIRQLRDAEGELADRLAFASRHERRKACATVSK